MKTNNQKNSGLRLGAKPLYFMTLFAVVAVAVVGFLQFSTFNEVSAQKREGMRATPEMIAYALTHEVADTATRFNIMNQLPCVDLDSVDLGGKSLSAGVYCLSSARLAGELTLDGAGDASSVFIFRVKGALTTADNSRIALANNAQAANIHFVAESAQLGANTEFRGSILTDKAVKVGEGATVKGALTSVSDDVQAREADAPEGAGTGTLEICKALDASAGNDISNRIFSFTVTGAVSVGTAANPVTVPVGSCSAPFEVLAGVQTISELNGGTFTNQAGTFTGGFQLNRVETVTTNSASTLGVVNRATRQATVNIVDGTAAQELTLRFVNQFAITGFVEICKRAAAVPASATLDPVSGMFTFTIEGVFAQDLQNASGSSTRTLQQFPVAVGQCTNAIAVTIATPAATGTPRESTVRVTELGNPNVSLESVNTVPVNRLTGVTLGQGVNASGGTFANAGGGFATVRVIESATPINETLINFVNRSNPGLVKVCKIAGPGIPLGTRFRFEVRGLAPGTPTAVPGVDVIRTVDVPAGPAATGGYCQFVEGSFVVGTNVLVTETRVLDPIPGSPVATRGTGGDDERDTGSFSVTPVTADEATATTVKNTTPAATNNIAANKSSSSEYIPGTIGNREAAPAQQSPSSPSALTPFVTETGNVSLSTDAVGSNDTSAIIQVQKPAGATTVRRAFLLAATIPPVEPNGFTNTTLNNTDITLDGSAVTFTSTYANPVDVTGSANNYLGEVTSLVQAKINAAPAGLIDFTVVENPAKNNNIDGEILVVIFNNPTQPVNTVVLLFGGLSQDGDSFTLNFTNPINKAAAGFALDLSLGISFSYQSAQTNGGYQRSTVDVSSNTRPLARLTSSAGGEDDGIAPIANGTLITVGGIGDTNANPPDPNALPNNNPRYDDELYSLAPFVNDGDTSVTINTSNPSRDDNIFFSAFFIGNNTLVEQPPTVVLTPPAAINPIGTQHTVTATVTVGGQPINNRQVTFTVLSGPNAGTTGIVNTNASGVANFTYTSNGQVGTDTIQACIAGATPTAPQICSNIATKRWVDPFLPDVCVSRIRLNGSFSGFVTAPATVQGITVNPNPNLTTRQAVFTVQPGVSVVEYANTVCRPTALKVCKIAATAGLLNLPFTFDIALVSPTDGNGIPLFPAASTSVVVNAGSAANGGNCAIVDGTNFLGGFISAGSTVTITERAAAGSAVTAITSSTSPTSTTNGISTNLTTRQATLTGALGLNGTNLFNIVTFTNSPTIAPPGTRPLAAFDFDGDGKADLSTFTSSTGNWRILGSNSGLTSSQFGASTDKPVAEDYDGDGKYDIAVYRSGTWFIQQSRDGFKAVSFGQAGDVPQPGDFDGDKIADVAVFRPSNGIWYILGSQAGFIGVQFGQNGDVPVVGDYDGDKTTDVAVYRPSLGQWYINGSTSGFKGFQFGIASDKVVPADYDGDGKTDIAVYRDGAWYLQRSTAGFTVVNFGSPADRPVPADYSGDGKADIAVYRSGMWYIQDTDQLRSVQFGTSNDTPIPSALLQ